MDKHHQETAGADRILRPGTIRIWKEDLKIKQASQSFDTESSIKDAAKLWNLASESKKLSKTIGTTSLPRSSFVRLLVPRIDTNTDHSIDI